MMRTTISKQPVSPPALVRTPADGGPRIDRKCDACAEDDQEIQRAVDPGAAPASGHQFARLSVLAAPPAAPAAPLAVSEPSDPSEQEAERAAEQVMRMLSAGAPRDEGPAISTAARPMVQRAVEQGAETAMPAVQGGFLVDDEAGSLLPGQMRKTEFLQALRPAVCAAADRELARAGRNTDGCPYLDRWFAYYAGRDARQGERSLRKYAPETARATSAADYIGPISERVAQGVRRWVDTGQVPELPEGVSADMLGGGGVLGALAEVGSAIGGAISSGLSAIGSFFGGLFFKANEGGAARGADRGALDARLGEGRPLDSASRSRMGSAFGYDFGAVRVHDDAPAAELARGLNARAFTLGTHVAFGANEYQPGQPVGDALLAHELAHVVQQGGARPSMAMAMAMAAPADHDAVEQDADAAAVAAVLSLWTPQGAPGRAERESAVPRLRSGLQLRCCGPQQKPPESAAPAAHSAPTKGACLPVVVNPTWDVAPQPITAGKGRCDLQLMKALVTPNSGFGLNGMEFKGTLSMPATCPGKAYFVQYVKPSRKSVACFDSKEEGFCANPGLGLDTAWPYPEGSVVNTDQDPGTSVAFNTLDSPGQKNISRSDLGLARICIEDSFTTYLVFEDKAGALTSLGWMSWSYTAHAVRDGGKCPLTSTTPDCAGWTVTGTGTKGSSDFTVGASAPQQALDRSVGAVNLMPSDCAPDGCPK